MSITSDAKSNSSGLLVPTLDKLTFALHPRHTQNHRASTADHTFLKLYEMPFLPVLLLTGLFLQFQLKTDLVVCPLQSIVKQELLYQVDYSRVFKAYFFVVVILLF